MRQDFGTGNVTAMTSPGLASFKALLVGTRQREREILADARKARRQLALSWTGRALAWSTLLPAISKPIRTMTNAAVAARRSDVATLAANLATSRISVSFDMDTAATEPHRRMLAAFDQLAGSQRVWVVQTTQ